MSLLLLLRRRMGREDQHWRPCRSTTAVDSRLLDAPPLLACKCKAAACRRPHGGAKRGRARHTACLRRVPLLDRHAATDRPGGFPLPPFPPRATCGNLYSGKCSGFKGPPCPSIARLTGVLKLLSFFPCCSALHWHVPISGYCCRFVKSFCMLYVRSCPMRTRWHLDGRCTRMVHGVFLTLVQ